ncbi:hypothetical protein, variant [Allomyces macrogynus ATCC 38327]|uniref:RING-type domain-containing protein n=1 Tax=Allomyces macrogynus (strain ATCC 38327) TaxID=578462 RepID=A0A0L0SXQ7_ALLM3|nr:hypothetical protein, variant [Allomyces macrogynus ATCC 38327]|eukprot:KNE67271.1 hypothetical protein, variant [Allomyces macrogynus ATCC 38327]
MEDDELSCPLCCEEIAPVDKYFFPCPCGYQICRFCWNHIREDHNQLCPACRRQFDDDGVQFRPVPPDELAKLNADRKRRAKRTKGGSSSLLGLDVDRSHLKDSKVYQRSLVYVTGLPPKYANEDLLRSDGYFGQFGRILKLSITRRPPQTIGGKTGENQIGVHVTFASPFEAACAIQYVEGSVIENRVLHATFGTNKYCPAWLVGRQCGTVGCGFLHEVTESADPATVPTVKTGTGGPPRYFGPRGRKPATAAGSGRGALSAPPDAADAQPPMSAPVHRPSPAPPERTRSPATGGGAVLPPTVNWAARKPDAPRPITPTNGVSPILSHRLFPDLSAAAAKPPEPKPVSARTVQRKPSVPAHLTADTAVSPSSTASTPPPAPATPPPPRIKLPKPEKPPVVEYEEPQPETRKQQLARVLALERQRAQEQQLAVDEDETPPESTPSSSHATRPPSPDVPLPPLDLGAYILATPPDRVPAVAYAGGMGTPTAAIQPAVATPWMLASALVLLNAMARPTDPDVYAGPFRPLDTGDLMHDIMEDRTVLAAPGGRNERAPKVAPHQAAVPIAPAAAPMSRHASLVALLNGHVGRTGGLHTPSPPPQQQQMPAVADVFKQMLMRGQAQQQGPMPSQMQQQQAMHPSLHADLLMRSRSPAPNPAGVAGLPFHDPAIMSVRMDYHQPLPQRPPTSSTAASTATPRGATPTMLQRLQESLAGKALPARMTPPPAPAPTSTPPMAGPPPGFGPKHHGVTDLLRATATPPSPQAMHPPQHQLQYLQQQQQQQALRARLALDRAQ